VSKIPVYKAKLRGKLEIDGELAFIGSTEIKTILPDHFDNCIFEVEVKVFEEKDDKSS